jgi:hypothetical protein
MIYWQTPLTKDMVAKAGYVYLPTNDLYYRDGSGLNLRLYPSVGLNPETWALMIHPAGQEPFCLCTVQGLSHLLLLTTVLEGDGNPIVFDYSKKAP